MPEHMVFQKPETQAIKYFCEANDFEFALNAHSYGNLLLFPLGYDYNAFAPDHDYFQTFSNHQVQFSGYNAIKSTGLYPVGGDSDDWMYADNLVAKPKIFALTPEVGSEADGFWPAQSRILPIARENVWMNLIQAHLPHLYGATEDLDPDRIYNTSGYFHYSFQRLGLENGTISVEITPLQGIQTIGSIDYHNINLMDLVEDSISFTLNSGITFGDEIKFILKTNFGPWTRHDTITKFYGDGNIAFIDNFNTGGNWMGDWGLTTEDYVSPSNAMTDSPYNNYPNNHTSETEVVTEDLSFENATYAYIRFDAKWEIETDWDYVQFMISTDNGNSWSPLCGNYTNAGNSNQALDEPLYDGFQTDWVLEEINLDAYIGTPNPKFKFRLVSDQYVTEDGFYFDDFKIFTDGSTLGIANQQLNDAHIAVYPNPTNSLVNH